MPINVDNITFIDISELEVLEILSGNEELQISDRYKINLKNLLAKYYLKTETYSQAEVNKLVSSMGSFPIKEVRDISEVVEEGIIYIIEKSTPEGEWAIYDEYMVIDGKPELIGSFGSEIDLSNYATKINLQEGLNTKQDKVNMTNMRVSRYNTETQNLEDSKILDDPNKVTIEAPLKVNGQTFHDIFRKEYVEKNLTGTLLINMPLGWSGSFNEYEIDIYNYSKSNSLAKIILTGNNNKEGYWQGASGYVLGDLPDKKIRFGYNNETKTCCILIGITTSKWSYLRTYITKVRSGYDIEGDWSRNWKIEVIDSELGIDSLIDVELKNTDYLTNEDIADLMLFGPYKSLPLNNLNNTFVLDYNDSNNGVIDLSSNIPNITNLQILNVPEGAQGKILIKQSGGKSIIPPQSIVHELTLPTQQNKLTLIEYQNIQGTIHLTQDIIVGDIIYKGPEPINTLTVDSFDGINISMKWVEPFSLIPSGLDPNISGYDIRYSHNPIIDDIGWLNAVKINSNIPIVGAGIENEVSVKLNTGLTYYIYIKTYKIYQGAYYSSPISNEIKVTTKTYLEPETGEPKRLPLSEVTTFTKLNKYQYLDGERQSAKYLYDKDYTPISIDDERPDIKILPVGTMALEPQKYWEDGLPYYVDFDLNGLMTLDSIYLYTKEKANLEVYVKESEIVPEFTHVGSLNITYNSWASVDLTSLENRNFRYIRISWETTAYAAAEAVPDGTPIWSTKKVFEGALAKYHFFGVFGYPISNKPTEILNPLRDYSIKHTIGNTFNANGHFYQSGRIFSLISGKYPRLFGAIGHFDAKLDEQTNRYATIADFKYKTEDISWVSGNGPNSQWTLRELLENTYKPYGLLPILTGTGTFDSVQRKTYVLDSLGNPVFTRLGPNTKIVDENYFDKINPPSPVKGIRGYDALFSFTFNPNQYSIYSKLAYVLAAKYGFNKLSPEQESQLPIETSFSREVKTSGLGLIGGFEWGNEQNRTWNGWEAYAQPEEQGAINSAVFDGNLGKLKEAFGVPFGMREGDPNTLMVCSGLVGIDNNYLYHADFHAKAMRKDSMIPLDVYSVHLYTSTLGIDQTNTGVARGLPWDCLPEVTLRVGELCNYRNRFSPNKQIWVTEFGFGEAGGYETQSKYAAYSLPGRTKNNITIPDIHRSEVKASWTIRSVLTGLSLGINAFNYYTTENEKDWFNAGQYGAGAGYEMWDWEKLPEGSIGLKVEAEKGFMIPFDRNGFSAMGLFGQFLSNGAYPIARGSWMIMTFRNRLKDYYFTGFKDMGVSDLKLACFSHISENKSAFLVWKASVDNDFYPNISVDIPTGANSVTKIDYYIPQIPDPRNVPYSKAFGVDQNRTGLPTSTRTYDSDGKVIGATLPTSTENPYFPIVGPISSFGISSKFPGQDTLGYNTIGANQYLDTDGETIRVNAELSWRQVDAICDFIQFSNEGIQGSNGIPINIPISSNKINIEAVTEVPKIYLIDGANIEPTYISEVLDLKGIPNSSSSVMLYWNNTNPKDTSYDVYISQYPEGGYELKTNIPVGINNEYLLSSLEPGVTVYVKLQPKYNELIGTLSNYVAVKPYDFVETPQNLTANGSSIASIRVEFDSIYESKNDGGFVSYTLERRETNGTVKSFTISDRTSTYFDDMGLTTGTIYSYRVKVITYGGTSEWTGYVNGRTTTPEEASPVVLKAETDVIVNVLRVTFDIDLGPIDSTQVINSLILTEDGNSRIITKAAIDVNDSKVLILTYYPETISSFDKELPLLLSYSNTFSALKSSYGNPVQSFNNYKVKNNYGNILGLVNTYQIDFNKRDNTDSFESWNSITPSDSTSLDITLKNKYEVNSPIHLLIPRGSITDSGVAKYWQFGPNSFTNGKYTSDKFNVPQGVYQTYGNLPYQANSQKNYWSELRLEGLNPNRRYTLHLYGSKPVNNTNTSYISAEVNGVNSGLYNIDDNTENFITFSEVAPINNQIIIKVFSEESSTGQSASINFMIIEEYANQGGPDDGTVFINNLRVLNQIS